jgi:hypothetical protein
LGVLIVFLAAVALGRITVVGVRDIAAQTRTAVNGDSGTVRVVHDRPVETVGEDGVADPALASTTADVTDSRPATAATPGPMITPAVDRTVMGDAVPAAPSTTTTDVTDREPIDLNQEPETASTEAGNPKT